MPTIEWEDLPPVARHPEASTLRGWIIALEIFAKHHKGGHHGIAGYHDVVYGPCATNQIPIDSEDGTVLRSLGWCAGVESDIWSRGT